jgi:hypothetical protein
MRGVVRVEVRAEQPYAETPDGTAWRCRAEHYLTDPSAEPDPAKWEVDVAYLAAGPQADSAAASA